MSAFLRPELVLCSCHKPGSRIVFHNQLLGKMQLVSHVRSDVYNMHDGGLEDE